MLVLEIAAGIVLGAVVLIFPREILTAVVTLAAVAAVLVIGGVLYTLAASLTPFDWQQLAVSGVLIGALYPLWRWLYWPTVRRGDG